jgi:dTDP-4-amino-4,6-dideoxygalactose transaminase
MIPYYTPHFSIVDLIRSFFTLNATDKLIDFFKSYTGKKHVLFTSSCRSSIYLAYYAMQKKGNVLVSPLTCQSAIEPIIWANCQPVFMDVNPESLNFDTVPDNFPVPNNTIAIQIINHGGLKVGNKIKEFAKKNNIKVIEDCAQSFGSEKSISPDSDIMCFSLIKTAYGLGGGILATDNENWYNIAVQKQITFPPLSKKVITYRIVKQILETNQKKWIAGYLYRKLIWLRSQSTGADSNFIVSERRHLIKPANVFLKYFVVRIKKMKKLQKLRNEKGIKFFEKLHRNNLANNYSKTDLKNSSFTKLFIYLPDLMSDKLIQILNIKGVEAKHLEHRTDNRTQPRFDKSEISPFVEGLSHCVNYLKVHDYLVSLPITEKMTEMEMEKIIGIIKSNIKSSL